MKTRGLSVKNVVAIGIGSAIYVILARFTSIPTPIPNTNIELVFPFLALLAAIYGAKVGFAVGFIGHALSDFIMYGQTWWSWVLATGIFGLYGFLIGLVLVLLSIATTPTFGGMSYFWPLIPFNYKALKALLFRYPTTKAQPCKVWNRGGIHSKK